MVACVEFPDLLGKRLLTKNWAAQAEWSTESRSPRAPPEKPWDQLKLLLRCAQFLRWLDRVKVTVEIRMMVKLMNLALMSWTLESI